MLQTKTQKTAFQNILGNRQNFLDEQAGKLA